MSYNDLPYNTAPQKNAIFKKNVRFEIKFFSSNLLDLTQVFQMWKTVNDEMGKIYKEKHKLFSICRYTTVLLRNREKGTKHPT